MPKIINGSTNFVKEPLLHPFGFKGDFVNDLWQIGVNLETDDDIKVTGVGCQNTLWSDKDVFSRWSPAASNSMMYLITEYAVKQLVGHEFETPFHAIDQILPGTAEFAKSITGTPDLRTTFVLNALVGVDHALWKLYDKLNGSRGFDAIIPDPVKPYLSNRYEGISIIPLLSYALSLDEIMGIVNDGYYFLKIKIGSDPDRDGDLNKMLEWDKRRIKEIHEQVKDIKTPYTDNGHIAYYLDANGQYDSIDRLKELIDYADSIGALERIILIEEPFPEDYMINVGDLPVIIAADERAHSSADVDKCIELGYSAIALKPIAKTISITFRMIEEAAKQNIPCFCADLTVNPLMVEVNKTFAARLGRLPGLKLPVVESNGWQNYTNWEKMIGYNPACGEKWAKSTKGGYELSDEFYKQSGGMFFEFPYYSSIVDIG